MIECQVVRLSGLSCTTLLLDKVLTTQRQQTQIFRQKTKNSGHLLSWGNCHNHGDRSKVCHLEERGEIQNSSTKPPPHGTNYNDDSVDEGDAELWGLCELEHEGQSVCWQHRLRWMVQVTMMCILQHVIKKFKTILPGKRIILFFTNYHCRNSRGVNWTLWPLGLVAYWRRTRTFDAKEYHLSF